ncbi:MAG: arginine decarboxylase, partial [Gaiellales bacterium]
MTRRSAARGRAPLVDLLALAADDPAYPFHMPGHRSGPGAPPLGLELFGERLYRLDRSEMGGLPYLHAPDRDIAEAQQLAADC